MPFAYKLPYTYKDYQMWEGDWELINGEAIAMAPSAFGPHQYILSKILTQLNISLDKCQNNSFVYAELDYIIDEYNVFRPDISVVCKKIERFIDITPKMVIEILSPSTSLKDTTIKFSSYEKEGVEFYMMVDYELRKLKLYKLINYKYVKIAEENQGEFKFSFDGCEVVFNIDKWWLGI